MTPEQKAMMKRASESLEAARGETVSGLHNNAVADAYYAMLHAARAALISLDLRFSSHRATHGAFGQEFARTGILPAELHRDLINAERARSAATYDYEVEMTGEDARTWLTRAEKFVRAIEDFLAREQDEDG